MSCSEEERSFETDVIDSFAVDKESNETKVDAGDYRMCIISVRVLHVAHAQHIELLLTAATSDVDREENRPCDAAAAKAEDDQDFEEPQPQVAIEGVVSENMSVWKSRAVSEKGEKARSRSRSSSLFQQQSLVGSWSVDS